jgi:esterase/lipase
MQFIGLLIVAIIILCFYFVYDVVSSPPSPPQPPQPPSPPLILIESNVAYGPNPINVMDIYNQELKSNTALVLVHGGGMIKGGKNELREVSIAQDMAMVGFDVFVPNYTLGTNSWPQNLADITLAIQFISSKYEKIIVMGLSAGATLALLYGISNSLASVIISMYGITSPEDRTYVDVPDKFRPGHIHQVVGSARCISCREKNIKNHRAPICSKTKNTHCLSDVWLDISPVDQLKQSTTSYFPKFILIHGDKDTIVNPNQLDIFHNTYNNIGLDPFRLSIIRVPNGQHGFDFKKNRDGSLLQIADLRQEILNNLE